MISKTSSYNIKYSPAKRRLCRLHTAGKTGAWKPCEKFLELWSRRNFEAWTLADSHTRSSSTLVCGMGGKYSLNLQWCPFDAWLLCNRHMPFVFKSIHVYIYTLIYTLYIPKCFLIVPFFCRIDMALKYLAEMDASPDCPADAAVYVCA